MPEAGREGHPPIPTGSEKDNDTPDEATNSSNIDIMMAPQPPPRVPGRTLLPSPIAGALSVSLNTTSAIIRAGTWLGGAYLTVGKFAVAKSASGVQHLIRGALNIAASEVSSSDLHRLEADGIVTPLLTKAHSNLTTLTFWTTLGANSAQGALESTGGLFLTFLEYLNQFFGSTDSSRAIASIIDMVLREYRNPATGTPGETVGFTLLVKSLCSLAYLQNISSKLKEEREYRASLEELLWDVVVLDDGSRLDVDGLHLTHKSGTPADQAPLRGAMDYKPNFEETSPDTALKRQVMMSLPSNASVDVATTTTVSQTISVVVRGTDVLPFRTPRGAEIVEYKQLDPEIDSPNPEEPAFRVVYRFQKHSVENTTIQGHGAYESPRSSDIDDDDNDDDDNDDRDSGGDENAAAVVEIREEKDSKTIEEPRPEVPPKSPRHRQPLLNNPTPSDGHAVVSGPQIAAPAANPPTTPTRGRAPSFSKPTSASKAKAESRTPSDSGDKKGGIRAALKRGPGSAISNLLLHKESASGKPVPEGHTPRSKRRYKMEGPSVVPAGGSRLPIPKRTSSASRRSVPHQGDGAAGRAVCRDLRPYEFNGADSSRPTSRASYISVHESKRDSMVSQTDSWSVHSRDGPGDDLRPLSPAVVRKEVATHSKTVTSSQFQSDGAADEERPSEESVATRHLCPTIYTLQSRGGSTASLATSLRQPSAFQDAATIRRLQRTGMISETFPKFHLVRNVVRYMRFSSATYGSMFLSAMGIGKELGKAWEADGHLELNVFAHHTGVPRDDILMASFVDTQGGSDASGSTNTNVPLVHYVVVDHESKAIVLACRGTMGFQDVVTDFMCEYDELTWRRRSYKVHKGIHASARRLLYGRDGQVLKLLKQALEMHEDYGLVLTGHSLGGGVTSLLGIMLAEPSQKGLGFVTSSQPHHHMLEDDRTVDRTKEQIHLPAGRPIHVYTYGPPGTMVPRLQKATRGLITSVIHGNDIVPYLSLGVLHDLQCVALAFQSEAGALTKAQVVSRIWDSCHTTVSRVFCGLPSGCDPRPAHDDEKVVAALKTLRASMTNGKLVPPGEVFVVETSQVLRRDAYIVDDRSAHIGMMAKRVIFKYIKDVEQRFREIRFESHMMLDHSPGRYEDALNKLYSGVAGPAES